MEDKVQKYLQVRCRAAKIRLNQLLAHGKIQSFQETKNNIYYYLQGMREMAYFSGYLNEEENFYWTSLFLDIYHSKNLEEIKAIPDKPQELEK